MDNSEFIREHKCPGCGGSLIFVPEKNKLVCEFCDTEYEIPEESESKKDNKKKDKKAESAGGAVSSGIGGFDFTKFYEGVPKAEGENLPIYVCKSCGAEVIAAYEEASLTCPYCTNKIVLSDKMSGSIRPDGIVPFHIPQNELKSHLDKFYKDKKLLPRNFFSQSKMEKVTGVYVPFWIFSGKLSGRYSFTGHRISTTTSNDYKITTDRSYDVERDAEVGFAGIPIDASDKIGDSLMDSVLPYDMNEVKPFRTEYLAGFAADRFDVPGKLLQARAERLMNKSSVDVVERYVAKDYDRVNRNGSSIVAGQIGVRYILLPVYMFNIKIGKKKYGFAINGQNGKVVGDIPTDKKVSRFYFWIRFLIVFGGIMGASLISYLMGGAF